MTAKKYIGFARYTGKLVESGLMDARKQAQALTGFDDAVRFFVCQQEPQLKEVDFEFPVVVKQSTWGIHVPEDIWQWIQTGVGIATVAYLATAGKKMAEKDFDGVGLKDLFSKSLKAIQWVIRIGRHLGDLSQREFVGLRWRNQNQEIGIPNPSGEYLFIDKEYFDLFSASSPKILSKLAALVEEERILSIGVVTLGKVQEESVHRHEKDIFTLEEKEPDDILFPELSHGQKVTLEGSTTRGNEETNSIGFKYKGHILNCYPATGSVVKYKKALFLRCKIEGEVSRADKYGGCTEKRPKIIFTNIEATEEESESYDLFPKA
jgi:hypothetical protein